MPTDEYIAQVKVIIQNQQQLDQLNEQVKQASIAFSNGQTNIDQYATSLATLGEKITTTKGAIGNAQATIQSFGETGELAGSKMFSLNRELAMMSTGSEAALTGVSRVASSLGAGGEMVLAIGAATAAIRSFVNHWDDVVELLADGGPVMTQLEKTKNAIDVITNALVPAGATGGNVAGAFLKTVVETGEEKDKAVKAAKDRAAEAEASRKAGEAARSKEEQQRGSLFRQAETQYGAPGLRAALVMKALTQARKGGKHLTQAEIDKVEENVDIMIQGARSGKAEPKRYEELFGKGFVETYEKVLHESEKEKRKRWAARDDKETNEAIKDEDEHRRKQDAALEKRTKEDIENEKSLFEMRKRQMQDEIENKIQVREDQARALEEQAREFKPSRIFSDTKSFSQHLVTAALDTVAKDQLKEAKGIHEQVRGLRRDLHLLNRMTFDD